MDPRLDRLIERAAGVDAIAVDMPLGLVEMGWRAADLEAGGAARSAAQQSYHTVMQRTGGVTGRS
ncbi:DUF429 domain-containing protein [Streptomyces monashensis]|uniref:DUF429 domain-containing protein n=1 Tax=Streptomyces monashensis TaxID=1678012 RepID=UPI003F5420C4